MVASEDIEGPQKFQHGTPPRDYIPATDQLQKNKMDSTTEETTSELKDVTNLASPKRKKRKVVRALFQNAKLAKKRRRMKKTKTHKERRERLKKKARAANTVKGLLCCSELIVINSGSYLTKIKMQIFKL